jgi:hypothetical protein
LHDCQTLSSSHLLHPQLAISTLEAPKFYASQEPTLVASTSRTCARGVPQISVTRPSLEPNTRTQWPAQRTKNARNTWSTAIAIKFLLHMLQRGDPGLLSAMDILSGTSLHRATPPIMAMIGQGLNCSDNKRKADIAIRLEAPRLWHWVTRLCV